MAKRTLVVRGQVTKMYLDERYDTGKCLAVISYEDPCTEDVTMKTMKAPPRRMVVPGIGFEIGQEVTIKVEID